jgi:hypothetical protein
VYVNVVGENVKVVAVGAALEIEKAVLAEPVYPPPAVTVMLYVPAAAGAVELGP